MSALSPSRVSWNRLFGIVNRGEEVGNFKIVNGTNGRVLGMIYRGGGERENDDACFRRNEYGGRLD